MSDLINGAEVFTGATTGVIANLVEKGVRAGWNGIKKYFKDTWYEEQINLGVAYEEYLHRVYKKYKDIKTFVNPRTPQSLQTVYVPTGVAYKNKKTRKDEKVNEVEISNLLEIDNKILITGIGGVGKSTMFKHLLLNAIESGNHIPVMVELRSFNSRSSGGLSIRKTIQRVLSDNGFRLEDEYFEYSLEQGAYLVLLDGFDELNRNNMAVIGEDIRSFSDRYPNNYFLLSSRPRDEFMSWNDFTESQMLPLTLDQAVSLVAKLDADETAREK